MKKPTRKTYAIYGLLLILFISSLIFINNNHHLYSKTIAEVTSTEITETEQVEDTYNNLDTIYTQRMTAIIKNGEREGQEVELINQYSTSGTVDTQYKVGNELFITLNEDSVTIDGYKRDTSNLLVAWVFIFILLLVGRRQGFLSLISLVINALILSYALDLYLKDTENSLVLICGISVILFTVISLLLVNGRNEKTYAAIVATLLGTFASLFITYIALVATGEQGLRYEEMQFLTVPYQTVFLAGLFIGSLGAVMDVAITMSSSLFMLYEKKPSITVKELKESGLSIGTDIMGTMTNILFFAYVCGSIPMLIIYLMSGSPLGFTLTMNLSLELARALAGGIGIVLTIPLGLFTSIYFINKKRSKA